MPPSISNQALQQQIIANALRNRAVYPQNPTTQPATPMMTNGGRPTPAPVAPPMPNPSGAMGSPMPQAQGGTPTQQVMKAAGQAQSPMMDGGTRQIAKQLIQKLMQHM